MQVEVGGKLQSAVVALFTFDDMLFLTANNIPAVGSIEANGTVYSDNTFTSKGHIKVLFKRISYSINGKVEEYGHLTATADTSMGTFTATGIRID